MGHIEVNTSTVRRHVWRVEKREFGTHKRGHMQDNIQNGERDIRRGDYTERGLNEEGGEDIQKGGDRGHT